MDLDEMRDFLINHNEEDYYKTKVEFNFAGKRYKTEINFAYFNGRLDQILQRNNVVYDSSWMMLKSFSKSGYNKYMDSIVWKLYQQGYDDDPQKVILEVLTLTNEMINHFNNGNKVSQDMNLLTILLQATEDKKLEKQLFDNDMNEHGTPEQIMKHRKENISFFKKHHVEGVTELLTSGYGIKDDQMINILCGLDLIPRIHDMNEIFPRPVATSWLKGLQNKDQFFMTANINVFALYMSKSVIQRSGVINKTAAMIAQDTMIVEHDCGSKHPVEYYVGDENDLATLRFKYMVNDDGSLEEITLDHKHLIGKTVKVRSMYTCNTPNGNVCEICFGANARWNKSTKEYNKDIGNEFTKVCITPIAQDIISTKHIVAPNLIPLKITYVPAAGPGVEKTLKNLDDNDMFRRDFNNIIWKPGVKVFLQKEDVGNPVYQTKKEKNEMKKRGIKLTEEEKSKKSLEYLDMEFGETDIIRSNCLIVEKTDGTKWKLYPNSAFRITGFNLKEFNQIPAETLIELDPVLNKVSYVIKNNAKSSRFFEIENLYKLSTPSNSKQRKIVESTDWEKDNVENLCIDYKDFINKVTQTLPEKPKQMLEVIFRNKIRDNGNMHRKPDWSSDNVDPVVLTYNNTITARPSLSLKIAAGRINQRLNDPFYHDPKNLMVTSYDRIYDAGTE